MGLNSVVGEEGEGGRMGIRVRYDLGEETATSGRAVRVRTSMELMAFLNVAIF